MDINSGKSPIIEKLSGEEIMLMRFGVEIFEVKEEKELDEKVQNLLNSKVDTDKILDILEIVLFQGGGLMTSKVRYVYKLLV